MKGLPCTAFFRDLAATTRCKLELFHALNSWMPLSFFGAYGAYVCFPSSQLKSLQEQQPWNQAIDKKTQEAVADTIHPHITSYYPVKNLSLVLDPVICGVPILRHPSLRHKKRPGVGGHQACKAWISQRQHFVKQRGFCEVHLHCGSTWKMTVRRKLEVVRDIFVIL